MEYRRSRGWSIESGATGQFGEEDRSGRADSLGDSLSDLALACFTHSAKDRVTPARTLAADSVRDVHGQ